jgi:hypothetical protein
MNTRCMCCLSLGVARTSIKEAANMQSLTLSTHAPHSVHRFGSSRPCRTCFVMASATPDQPSTSGRPADAPSAAPAAGPRAAAAGPSGRPRPSPRQMPPRIGPNGRPMMMGPDGQPVEVCAEPCQGRRRMCMKQLHASCKSCCSPAAVITAMLCMSTQRICMFLLCILIQIAVFGHTFHNMAT